MCSFANQFAFVSGGYLKKKVFRIDLTTDIWVEMPKLVEAVKIYSSSCTLSNFMYVYDINPDSETRNI